MNVVLRFVPAPCSLFLVVRPGGRSAVASDRSVRVAMPLRSSPQLAQPADPEASAAAGRVPRVGAAARRGRPRWEERRMGAAGEAAGFCLRLKDWLKVS